MKLINLLMGIIGIFIGAILLANGNEGADFLTKFTIKLIGILFFVGAIFFVLRFRKLSRK